MAWNKGERIPTNLIVGFLGSGKTTAITKLVQQRPAGENWSILINEFGTVSIDHALIDSSREGIAVEELGGGCACCTLAFAFKPLLAQFVRRTKPDRLILEPSGLSHPAKVVDILRSEDFAGAIDLRNIICLIDPKDFEDPRWQETEVFQDQVQLADIVVLNWVDSRDRELINRCREWVESFRPPKQLILEASFGAIDPQLLDIKFETIRSPLFADAHAVANAKPAKLPILEASGESSHHREVGSKRGELPAGQSEANSAKQESAPGQPLRFPNGDSDYEACGWIFHVDDVFDRNKLLDLLGTVRSIVRLKGIFRCDSDWWMINRAKDGTNFVPSTYRRDSRLEIIVEGDPLDWSEFENQLFECLTGSSERSSPRSFGAGR